MRRLGKVTKVNIELRYAFIKLRKFGEVFISEDTDYVNCSFDDLLLDEKVAVEVLETPRGLFGYTVERP